MLTIGKKRISSLKLQEACPYNEELERTKKISKQLLIKMEKIQENYTKKCCYFTYMCFSQVYRSIN